MTTFDRRTSGGMMFHLPHGHNWDPKSVCDLLRSHCVNASLVGTSIRISLSGGKRQTILRSVLDALDLRPSKFVSLNYDPTKFLHNVELKGFLPQTRGDLRCYDDIESAMLRFGCLVDSERTIAARYCPENVILVGLFDEIDRLNVKIEQLISAQDFANAALRRKEASLIRTQIDAILFASVSK